MGTNTPVPARVPCVMADGRRAEAAGGCGTQEEPPDLAVPGALAPTHLLMYSAFSSFPQVLHLKQPKCQCLSRATRDWPFFISMPQPPQPGGETRTQMSSPWAERSGGPRHWVSRHP